MNAHIELREITKRFGAAAAVDRVTLAVRQGELVSLLGPSGCGKTTTLNLIAGFLDADAGDIVIDGKSMAGVPPYRRNLGMVFQNFALFPHMTVAENVAFGLRMRDVPRTDIDRRVREALELVELGSFADRYRHELSGGQSQRVALARALVVQPTALLLDEPFSSLDANLREQLRIEVRTIQQRVGITTIFVTHDQSEALAMSDKVVVMNKGRIEQAGSPGDVYHASANPFVARFVGQTNLLEGRIVDCRDGVCTIAVGPLRVRAKSPPRAAGSAAIVGIRPEAIVLNPATALDNVYNARLVHQTFLGAITHCTMEVDGVEMRLQLQNAQVEAPVGATVRVGWSAQHAHVIGD